MAKRSSTPTDERTLAKWLVDHLTIEAKAQREANRAVALGRPRAPQRRNDNPAKVQPKGKAIAVKQLTLGRKNNRTKA